MTLIYKSTKNVTKSVTFALTFSLQFRRKLIIEKNTHNPLVFTLIEWKDDVSPLRIDSRIVQPGRQ
jgi:hypothetical protein